MNMHHLVKVTSHLHYENIMQNLKVKRQNKKTSLSIYTVAVLCITRGENGHINKGSTHSSCGFEAKV